MKKKTAKKLKLRPETLRLLSPRELQQAPGGQPIPYTARSICGCTYYVC